jgi:hypothetical protein
MPVLTFIFILILIFKETNLLLLSVRPKKIRADGRLLSPVETVEAKGLLQGMYSQTYLGNHETLLSHVIVIFLSCI